VKEKKVEETNVHKIDDLLFKGLISISNIEYPASRIQYRGSSIRNGVIGHQIVKATQAAYKGSTPLVAALRRSSILSGAGL